MKSRLLLLGFGFLRRRGPVGAPLICVRVRCSAADHAERKVTEDRLDKSTRVDLSERSGRDRQAGELGI
jgi:hypothetical protein